MAEELAGEFADGVCFVSLTPIWEPDLVIPTIARTLGLRELGERTLSEHLAPYKVPFSSAKPPDQSGHYSAVVVCRLSKPHF